MYRLAVASLLVLALMDMATACPPAQFRVSVGEGRIVKEYFCDPGQVLYRLKLLYRCFQTCDSCPNGFCYENVCYCFPGTQVVDSGVCGKICPNCENGWCSSVSTCECNEGFTLSNGRCVRSLSSSSNQTSLCGLKFIRNTATGKCEPDPNLSHDSYSQGSTYVISDCIPGFKRNFETGRCEPILCPRGFVRNRVTNNCESSDDSDEEGPFLEREGQADAV